MENSAPLTIQEKQILLDDRWIFYNNDTYIERTYEGNDEDFDMADGIKTIRCILEDTVKKKITR
jgi:hypothetical protein